MSLLRNCYRITIMCKIVVLLIIILVGNITAFADNTTNTSAENSVAQGISIYPFANQSMGGGRTEIIEGADTFRGYLISLAAGFIPVFLFILVVGLILIKYLTKSLTEFSQEQSKFTREAAVQIIGGLGEAAVQIIGGLDDTVRRWAEYTVERALFEEIHFYTEERKISLDGSDPVKVDGTRFRSILFVAEARGGWVTGDNICKEFAGYSNAGALMEDARCALIEIALMGKMGNKNNNHQNNSHEIGGAHVIGEYYLLGSVIYKFVKDKVLQSGNRGYRLNIKEIRIT